MAYHHKSTHSGIELVNPFLPTDIYQHNEPVSALALGHYLQDEPYGVATQIPVDFQGGAQSFTSLETSFLYGPNAGTQFGGFDHAFNGVLELVNNHPQGEPNGFVTQSLASTSEYQGLNDSFNNPLVNSLLPSKPS